MSEDTIDGEEYHEAECRDCLTTRRFNGGKDGYDAMMHWVRGHISEKFDTPCERITTRAVYPDGQTREV